jgi:hypothetical protein
MILLQLFRRQLRLNRSRLRLLAGYAYHAVSLSNLDDDEDGSKNYRQ